MAESRGQNTMGQSRVSRVLGAGEGSRRTGATFFSKRSSRRVVLLKASPVPYVTEATNKLRTGEGSQVMAEAAASLPALCRTFLKERRCHGSQLDPTLRQGPSSLPLVPHHVANGQFSQAALLKSRL